MAFYTRRPWIPNGDVTLTVTANDNGATGNGGALSSVQTVLLDVVPSRAATFTGDATGSLIEDQFFVNSGNQVVFYDFDSGTLTVHDVDDGEDQFQGVAEAALHGTYGDFTFNAGGRGMDLYAR